MTKAAAPAAVLVVPPGLPPEFIRLQEMVRRTFKTEMLWDSLHPYNNCDCALHQYVVQTVVIDGVAQVDAHYPTCPIGKWQELGRRMLEAGLFDGAKRAAAAKVVAKAAARAVAKAAAKKPIKAAKPAKPAKAAPKSAAKKPSKPGKPKKTWKR